MTKPPTKPPTLKAIETFYNGYRFRSRLEARWAVFLDTLDIGFRYEMEGYDLDGLLYLPDFYLPHLDSFLEIKPTPITPNSPESHKATRLADLSEKRVFVFAGPCWFPFTSLGYDSLGEGYEGEVYGPGYWDNYQAWCECSACGFFSIQFEGRSYRSPCGCWRDSPSDRGHNISSPRLGAAYHAARAMQFEFRK